MMLQSSLAVGVQFDLLAELVSVPKESYGGSQSPAVRAEFRVH